MAIPFPDQDEISTILLESYHLVRKVAQGENSVVYEVVSTRGRLRARHLALKKALRLPAIVSSVLLHRTLCHPNVVTLHAIIDTEVSPSSHCNYWHVLEFCSDGNLSDLLRSRNPSTFTHAELRQITKGIAKALVYLKEERIIHRDVDSTNILVAEGCIPKLCDFKHAVRLPFTKKYISQPLVGTTHPAPELLAISSHYDFAVDAWSFGCVLYLCTGGTIDKIKTLSPENSFSMFPEPPTDLQCLIVSLLTPLADIRLSAEQITKHAYLTVDPSASKAPSSLGESSRRSFTIQLSAAPEATDLLPVSSTKNHYPSVTQKLKSQLVESSPSILRPRERTTLKDIRNIPLPRFLSTNLASVGTSVLKAPKYSYCSAPTTSGVARPTSDISQETVIAKTYHVEKEPTLCDDSTSPTKETMLPIGTTRPQRIDSTALTPKTHKLANGTITVLASRALLVDFRQSQRRHGLKGDQIMLIESTAISIFDAPHLSVPSCLLEPIRRYNLTELPSMYWKQYNDAADFVDLIRRKIPHMTVYGSEFKCTLMSNPSPSDIEVILYGDDPSTEKTKIRGGKVKNHTPALRIQYSRQYHSLELAQRLTGEQGTEWKKELRTCLDSCEISRISLLDDTDLLIAKGLSILLDFLKTCDQLELPSEIRRTLPASKSRPGALPFVYDNLDPLDNSRYLRSIGWCIRCLGTGSNFGDTKYLYQILFVDGSTLVVDLGGDSLVFSSVDEDPASL